MSQSPLFDDPFDWFDAWFKQAQATIPVDPNAVTLATVSAQGQPSARIVLLKEWDRDGFVIYTNLKSRKGQEALGAGLASLSFYWPALEQQVRIEGPIAQVSDARADAYFATRPRTSQLGAWASHQSQPLASREALLERVAALEAQYEGLPVPRPPHWSGLCLSPTRMEFWHAGEFRLHDRFVFTRSDLESPWHIERLNP